MPPEPPRRIGHYEILETLGSGAMGTVYLAQDSHLQRRVALKVLRVTGNLSDDDARNRVMHEARTASTLNHPNICQIYEVGGSGRESWIAMEYVTGPSLASIVRSRGPLPSAEVIRLGTALAEALAHAHHRGIVHGDLKSANVAVDEAGRAKVLDFGLSRRLAEPLADDVTHTTIAQATSVIDGTPAYMSPETIAGQPRDERVDLWALGVLLYELQTGVLPFQGHNLLDLAATIARGPAPELPPDTPPRLAEVLSRLLSRDPARRYATAAQVAAALEACEDGLTTRPTGELRRRRPAIMAAIAVAAAAIVGLAVAWWLPGNRTLQLVEQRLVATAAQPVSMPSFSPDGSLLAYVAPDDAGVRQIWVRDIEHGTAIQVTHGTAPTSRPRWLPTTGQLMYAVAGQGIWTVPPMGGTPTRLIERGTNPNVARNGSRVVFEDRRALWTAAPDGSEVQPVPGVPPVYYSIPMAPALSPDGSTIAYFHAEAGPNGDLWTIPAEGGAPTRLTSDLREGGWPVWTPDGRTVIFSSARAGSRTLWQIPAEGGEPTPLTIGAGEDNYPEISADGQRVAYTNVRNRWELRVHDLASDEERTLVERGLELLFPMFSPDGSRIAYFGRADYAVAIFTIGADGTDLRQLTGGRELNHQPRWSHDGRYVYYYQLRPTVSFRRSPALGGPGEEFRPWDWTTESAPYFDPTGRYLAYVRQAPLTAPGSVREATVIHELATGEEHAWAGPHTHVGGWSPDGTSIVGWQHGGSSGSVVVTCRVADESCTSVTNGEVPKFAPDGDRVYFVRAGASGTYDLWSAKIDGSDERRLFGLGQFRPIDVFFDVSPRGEIAWAPFEPGDQQLWTAIVG